VRVVVVVVVVVARFESAARPARETASIERS
jgi:hypothetical protein